MKSYLCFCGLGIHLRKWHQSKYSAIKINHRNMYDVFKNSILKCHSCRLVFKTLQWYLHNYPVISVTCGKYLWWYWFIKICIRNTSSIVNPLRTTFFSVPPFDSSENWCVKYCICTYATVKCSVLRMLGLKKASIIDLFQKCKDQNFNFLIFSKKFHSPYFNTQHFICEKDIYFTGVPMGSQKLFQVGFVKRVS